MDSKIRRMAILASMGVILLVSLLVLYANGDQEARRRRGLRGLRRKARRRTRGSRARERAAWSTGRSGTTCRHS